MNSFEQHFFGKYIRDNETLIEVFHKHFMLIIEDIFLWMLFWIAIPGFLYYHNSFEIQTVIPLQYVYGYMFLIYGILLYKLFDWYNDVWIATDIGLVDVNWWLFSENVVYVDYSKVEWIELRTRTLFDALLWIADVNIRLASGGHFILHSAYGAKHITHFVQDATKWITHKHDAHEEDDGSGPDKVSFDILVETLSEVVKKHLHRKGKDDLTEDYIEKLDTTLIDSGTVDLRSDGDKAWVEDWKKKFQKAAKKDAHKSHDEWEEDDEHDSHGWHGHH